MHLFGLHCHDMRCAAAATIPLRVRIAGPAAQLQSMLLTVWYVRRDGTGKVMAGPTPCYSNAHLDRVQNGTTASADATVAFNRANGDFEFTPANPGLYEITFHVWDGTTPPTPADPQHFFHHPVIVHVS